MNDNNELEYALRQERSQSVVRVAVASVVLLALAGLLLVQEDPLRARNLQAISVVFVFWLAAGLWLLWLWSRQRVGVYTRRVALGFDIVATTAAMILAGKIGAFFYPVYQWIIVGHGVRFGRGTMLAAAALAVVGFGIVIVATPYWHENLFLASGLLVGLIVLPMYLASLLSRLSTLNEQLQQELARTFHSARHDTLTELPNRHTFFEALERMIVQSARIRRGFAVMFIDLDDFKDINDRYGHLAGDRILAAIAARLMGCCRENDMAARFGGDEFALLAEGIGDRESAAITAGRIAEAIAEDIAIDEANAISMTASIGISLFPLDGESPAELTHAADLAMYAIKRAGKKGHACFADLDSGGEEDQPEAT